MDFKNYLEGRDLGDLTVKAYLAGVDVFCDWFMAENFEPLAIEDLTPTDLRSYRAALVAEGLAPASINQRLAAVRAFCNWAVAEGLIRDNPADGIRGIRRQGRPAKWLDKKQQARLIREVEKAVQLARSDPAIWRARRDLAVVQMILNAGLRVSEVVGLRFRDLAIGPRSGKVSIIGKGNKSRQVPLNAIARGALLDWLDLARPAPADFVFPGPTEEAPGSRDKRSGLWSRNTVVRPRSRSRLTSCVTRSRKT